MLQRDGTVVAATRSGTQDSQCGSRLALTGFMLVTVDTCVKRLPFRIDCLLQRSDPIERFNAAIAAARVREN